MKKLNHFLIEKFPELEKEYHAEVDWQKGDDTGSHVIYGDVFAPYIEKNIDEREDEKLKKIFDFIEEILLQKEKYSVEVIMFSVLERLIADEKRFQICKRYMGKQTELIIKEMQ